MSTLATPRNMSAAADKHTRLGGSKVRAYDPTTGEIAEVSVSASDYFMLGVDEPLMSADGCEPLLLVTVKTRQVILDALEETEITEGEETIPVESVEWRIYDAGAEEVHEEFDSEREAIFCFESIGGHSGPLELHSRKVSAWEVVA